MESFELNPYFMPSAAGGMFTLYIVVLVSNVDRLNAIPKAEQPSITQIFYWTIAAGVLALLGLFERGIEAANEWEDVGRDLLACFIFVATGYGWSMVYLINSILKAPVDIEVHPSASERVKGRIRKLRSLK
jgi:4-hydroxybenzoate polyprenyltransferase